MKAALRWAQNQDAMIKNVAPINGFLDAAAERADAGKRLYVLAVLREVPVEQCWLETNAKPIGTKWIDIDEGDGDRVEIRSRLLTASREMEEGRDEAQGEGKKRHDPKEGWRQPQRRRGDSTNQLKGGGRRGKGKRGVEGGRREEREGPCASETFAFLARNSNIKMFWAPYQAKYSNITKRKTRTISKKNCFLSWFCFAIFVFRRECFESH